MAKKDINQIRSRLSSINFEIESEERSIESDKSYIRPIEERISQLERAAKFNRMSGFSYDDGADLYTNAKNMFNSWGAGEYYEIGLLEEQIKRPKYRISDAESRIRELKAESAEYQKDIEEYVADPAAWEVKQERLEQERIEKEKRDEQERIEKEKREQDEKYNQAVEAFENAIQNISDIGKLYEDQLDSILAALKRNDETYKSRATEEKKAEFDRIKSEFAKEYEKKRTFFRDKGELNILCVKIEKINNEMKSIIGYSYIVKKREEFETLNKRIHNLSSSSDFKTKGSFKQTVEQAYAEALNKLKINSKELIEDNYKGVSAFIAEKGKILQEFKRLVDNLGGAQNNAENEVKKREKQKKAIIAASVTFAILLLIILIII